MYFAALKSLITYVVMVISLIIFSMYYYPKYKQGGSEATISWDVSGYYWYLPSAFIYHDLKEMKFSDSIRKAYSPSPDNQQITELPNGQHTLKYSCGMAVQYLPFFLTAHVLAPHLGYLPDGFSPPYQVAIHIGAMIMMLLGLWYLRKFLLFYFKDSTVAWVLFFLVVATNYLNYAGLDVGMSHAWLFSWYCMLFYQTHQFYAKSTFWRAAFIGFICGLLALSRPTEIISIIIPLSWGVHFLSKKSITERLLRLKNEYKKMLLAGFVMVCVGSLQLFYWKYVTGHWFVYSYGDQHFSWFKPHLYDYLFSYKNGWILYTPFMVLPYIGFVCLYKKPNYIGTLLLFSLLYLWAVSAWDVWWYGGRAMLQGSAALMFPLAALIEFVHQKKWLIPIFYPIAFFAAYLNIWWVHGTHYGGYVDASNMTRAYYHKVFARMHIHPHDKKLLDVEDDYIGTPKGLEVMTHENFNQELPFEIIKNRTNYYFPNVDSNTERAIYCNHPPYTHEWIRVNTHVICARNNWNVNTMTRLGLRFFKRSQVFRENYILVDRLFYDKPEQDIYFDTHIFATTYDSVHVYIYTPRENAGAFYFSRLYVESFN